MTVLAPQSVITPPPSQDLYIVRGDTFVLPLGFSAVPEVVANPAQYRIRMVLRRRQSDNLPDILAINAVFEVEPNETVRGVPLDLIATLSLTPDQTQTIPQQGCVYFIEWTNAIGGANSRIAQGRVEVGD